MTEQAQPDERDALGDWLDEFAKPIDLPAGLDVGDRGAPIGESGAIRWEELDGEDRGDVWEKLRRFVDWFVQRYGILDMVIPACWYRHPAIVEELTALMSARAASFSDGDQGLGPIGWHERAALVRQRIETLHYRGECQSGHIPAPPRAATDVDDWDSWLEEDAREVAERGPLDL